MTDHRHRANFEAFLIATREWNGLIFARARSMFPEAGYTDIKDVSNCHWIAARQAVEAEQEYQPPAYPYPEIIPRYRGK